MKFETIERKIMRPPAAHNVARLLDPSCELKTTQNIARFSVSIPSFNYIPGLVACKDRVRLKLDRLTALKVAKEKGSPAGRDQNAALVDAFFDYDEVRRYSDLRVFDDYEGQFRISREISVPTKPTFTVFENGKLIPVVICGWKDLLLARDQIRAWVSMLDSGLFSIADHRNSPWEIRVFPEQETAAGKKRQVYSIGRGDLTLFSESDMRELASMYARAQRAAMPLARELWERQQQRQRERMVDILPSSKDTPDQRQQDLFGDG